jgi:hypothetical protein
MLWCGALVQLRKLTRVHITHPVVLEPGGCVCAICCVICVRDGKLIVYGYHESPQPKKFRLFADAAQQHPVLAAAAYTDELPTAPEVIQHVDECFAIAIEEIATIRVNRRAERAVCVERRCLRRQR